MKACAHKRLKPLSLIPLNEFGNKSERQYVVKVVTTTYCTIEADSGEAAIDRAYIQALNEPIIENQAEIVETKRDAQLETEAESLVWSFDNNSRISFGDSAVHGQTLRLTFEKPAYYIQAQKDFKLSFCVKANSGKDLFAGISEFVRVCESYSSQSKDAFAEIAKLGYCEYSPANEGGEIEQTLFDTLKNAATKARGKLSLAGKAVKKIAKEESEYKKRALNMPKESIWDQAHLWRKIQNFAKLLTNAIDAGVYNDAELSIILATPDLIETLCAENREGYENDIDDITANVINSFFAERLG